MDFLDMKVYCGDGQSVEWLVVDLVDRLSTPIQFMSLAEKRTKQMKGMGFDENDISDEAVTSSASMKQHVMQEQAPSLPAAGTAANGKTTVTSQPQAAAAGPTPSSQQVPVAVDKKEKKGN